jgi:cytochrome b561
MAAAAQRYTAIAIILHWAIAFAILFMIPLGLWMHEAMEHGPAAPGVYAAFQLHKSVGLTILALSLVRLGWRLANPPPPLPAHMPAWERLAAKATHWGFYALMIGLPLTGWLYVSTGWSPRDDAPLAIPTYFFGLFRVPGLFGLGEAEVATRAAVAEATGLSHKLLAYGAIGLAALHVGAALKHQFIDRDEVLAHMVPGLKAPNETSTPPKNAARGAALGLGFALIGVAAAATLYTVATLGAAAPPAAPSTIEIAAPTPETAPAPTTAAPTPTAETPIAPAAASAWTVDAGQSAIRFSFDYVDDAGNTRINGQFNRWRADIRFDPANLEQSRANVSIDVASAADGIPLHEQYLPTANWFDAANHPQATFVTRSIRHQGGDRYEARGELTIKGRTRNATLPFTLTINGDRASMSGALSIDRQDFDIGKDADGEDQISRQVQVNVRVDATRAP